MINVLCGALKEKEKTGNNALRTILNVDHPLTSFISDPRYKRYEKRGGSKYFKAFLKQALCVHMMRRDFQFSVQC